MLKTKIYASFSALYLLFIALSIGLILASAFSASVVFRGASLAEGLDITLFQSGILMTQIFIKVNFLLNILALLILIYELITLQTTRQKFIPLLGFINAILILLFTLYYTPYIIEAQTIGESAIETLEFNQMHQQSELVFKTLLITLILLFFTRFFGIFNSVCKGK
ncbi:MULTISPECIES: DUF4149 domain-containing protein [Helicobacter]|uniref:DUF4149 domain-containing protein n=1 Tax=Helicobacter TaxID=209 RepID=UPI000DCB8333|nr:MULTISPECIES: DUF4149 domain-containing protein [Helicobacter]MCI7047582.1 DUF4149 domain-containing protein [Helicobacter sp.]MCI7766100.1 DUF4149 domain-containing protein [Helicobacter sp.]MCL9821416.1 DUF4149 domain-containing protein [Helicobacter colisuis]MCL9823076.1 DUF4149 domain-containing protein [Helicobacter colisuis]MDY4426525.1 DUF4149 domain-containing protein [Helicobacter sp.]